MSSTNPLDKFFRKKFQSSKIDYLQVEHNVIESNILKRPIDLKLKETESSDSEPPCKIHISTVTPDKTGSKHINDNELRFHESTKVDSGNTKIPNKKSITEEEQSIHVQESQNTEYFTHAAASAFISSRISPDMFWGFHPQQPMHNVPFTAKKVFSE